MASFFCFAQKDTCKFILVDTVSNDTVGYYMASNVNGWNPEDENFKFKKDKDGTNYLICYFEKRTMLEFKFTRGSWERVECSKSGLDIENRKIRTDTAKLSVNYISGWKTMASSPVKKHTASVNVKILDTAFFIPQLNRFRRIWVYLPQDYSVSRKRYPVIYMQDGQNIFDDFTSGYGEWGVDECLDSMIAKGKPACIIVAVANSEKRMNEYNPYLFTLKDSVSSETFLPEGDAYAAFLGNTLKPFVDKHYRTIKSKENTIIAGSSLGGLISMYTMLKYPEIFGKAGIFSPAFWVAPGINALADSVKSSMGSRIFFYIGRKEGSRHVHNLEQMADLLAEKSDAKIYSVIDENGEHNEAAWRKWFPEFYQWILSDGYQYTIPVPAE